MSEHIKIACVLTTLLAGATTGWMIGSAYENTAPSWEQLLHEAEMNIHAEYSRCDYLGYRLDFKNNASLIGSNGASTKTIHIYDCNGVRKEAMHNHEKLVKTQVSDE